ncbi:MAG: nucleotidyltransferase domain-containing protein [bacterium]|nr:nucleotidyltransferase domain-containing protein [bacterium]
MEDIQIVREFKANVSEIFPDAEIYFYGSRVRKNHREDSDYDVLVLLKEIKPAIRKRIYDIAWETGFKYDAVIAPVLSPLDAFYPSTASPFFNNVKRYGVAV